METWNKFSRRRFVQLSLLGAGSALIFSQCLGNSSIWCFFTEPEARMVDSIVDQIIPPDEWPGGRDVGVTNFIDKQLVGPYVRFQEKYREGLRAIQNTCESRFQKSFDELDWGEQTRFLEAMEAGNMPEPVWVNGLDREFFGLIRSHSMQGYYGSPRHGGNKDYVSYRMIGLDYPFTIGQNRYKS